MSIANSIFDDIYVINLDKDTQRLKSYDDMMKKLNWRYTRFSAITPKDFSNEYIAKLKDKMISNNSKITDNEISCALSHIILWNIIAKNSKNRVLIMEDDARTIVGKDKLEEYLSNLYNQFANNNGIQEPDILYLGKCMDNCSEYKQIYENVYQSFKPLCNHSYVLTKEGARKLLNYAPYSDTIDMAIRELISKGKITAYVYHPSLFYQDIISHNSNLRNLGKALNNVNEFDNAMNFECSIRTNTIIKVMILIIIILLIFVAWLIWKK